VANEKYFFLNYILNTGPKVPKYFLNIDVYSVFNCKYKTQEGAFKYTYIKILKLFKYFAIYLATT